MSERGIGFLQGLLFCSSAYFIAFLYQRFKEFTDKYEVLIYEKDLDGEQ